MRDWEALGQERLLVTPLSRFRQGTPIKLDAGVLFTTYATLRSQERGEKVSRVQQIVDWLGADFDGVIIESEEHTSDIKSLMRTSYAVFCSKKNIKNITEQQHISYQKQQQQ